MSRQTTSTSFVTPIKSDGTVPAQGADSNFSNGRGVYTLEAGALYFFPVGGQDAATLSAHFQWDAEIILTSITLEDSDMPGNDVSDYASSAAGSWIDEDPPGAFVGTKGAGVTVSAVGVVAVAGGAAGGCRFDIETAARRTRFAVQVGATGGQMRCATWGKE